MRYPKDEFVHPFGLFDKDGRCIGTGFRKRNHLIPCSTRRKKTMRRQVLRLKKVHMLAYERMAGFIKCL